MKSKQNGFALEAGRGRARTSVRGAMVVALGVSLLLGGAAGCGGAAHRAQVADLRRTLERLREVAPYATIGPEVEIAPVGVVGQPPPDVIPSMAIEANGDVLFHGRSIANVHDQDFATLRAQWELKRAQLEMLRVVSPGGPIDLAVAVTPTIRTDDVRRVLAEIPGALRVHFVFRLEPNPMPAAVPAGAESDLVRDLEALRAMPPSRRDEAAMMRTYLALSSCPEAREVYSRSFRYDRSTKIAYFLEHLADAVARCDHGLVDMVRVRALIVSELERPYGRPSVLVPLDEPIRAEQAAAMPTFGEFAAFLQRSYPARSAAR